MAQSSPRNPESVYSDHLISQIKANLDLLLQRGKISPSNFDAIDAALPPLSENSAPSLQRLSLNGPRHQSPHTSPFPNPPPQIQAPEPPAPLRSTQIAAQKQARALWAYRGSAADDLSFEKGDIIVVLSEENEDWWRGQLLKGGPSGLFPSNHVEALPANVANTVPSFPSAGAYHSPSAPNTTQHPQSYSNPGLHSHVQQPMYNGGAPNPAWPGPSHNQPPYQAQYQGDNKSSNALPQQPPPPMMSHTQSAPPVQIQVEKTKKGALQGRFGQALVGGAGFGAGSAVASHVVNAIL